MLGDTAAFVCQSPICRDTHFYKTNMKVVKTTVNRVNPLYVGTPISTLGMGHLLGGNGYLCQSPICRDTHFYWLSSIHC